MDIEALIKAERWEIKEDLLGKYVELYEERFDLNKVFHPFQIHAKLYRILEDPELKYYHMKKFHDYLWPNTKWHEWTADRFKEHCNGWKFISYAGGANTTKSYDAAKIALLFWLADPRNRGVIVASTTLESAGSRIWGYIKNLIREVKLPLQFRILKGGSPKILYDREDTIHGMFAIAAARGGKDDKDDESAIKNYIGRHPNNGLMVILDEATDLMPSILKALPNLSQKQKVFQCMVLGNSLSKFDLHGALSTPKIGWKNIDPMKHFKWETTQESGICMFFSCYNSPAVLETNPIKLKELSEFLITKEDIAKKKIEYGETSPAFWRFILGFWQEDSLDPVVVNRKFLEEYDVERAAHFSGLNPLHIVAGLDPSFGGDECILQFAIIGQEVSGKIVIDFRGTDLTHRIKLNSKSHIPIEIQLAEQVIDLLEKHRCPLSSMAMDTNGQARALPELIRLKANQLHSPIKLHSIKMGTQKSPIPDLVIKTSYELWEPFKLYIQNNQIRGLNLEILQQLTSRLVLWQNKKPVLEEKRAYKARMTAINPANAHSPDAADAASLALQAAIIKHGFIPGQEMQIKQDITFIDSKIQEFIRLQGGIVGNKAPTQRPLGLTAGYGKDITSLISGTKLPF